MLDASQRGSIDWEVLAEFVCQRGRWTILHDTRGVSSNGYGFMCRTGRTEELARNAATEEKKVAVVLKRPLPKNKRIYNHTIDQHKAPTPQSAQVAFTVEYPKAFVALKGLDLGQGQKESIHEDHWMRVPQ